ncbi:hypothetical protein sS8_2325 [Methylocaldum marinum]|uniref:Uncharacterized protein n=1 Tax=Methylocaldum marinum TaxID=1432792 RepID=A0A250KRQ0_9GAMM|nr:hypothetical protein sS8_2325 [Methylocaldum marinum]
MEAAYGQRRQVCDTVIAPSSGDESAGNGFGRASLARRGRTGQSATLGRREEDFDWEVFIFPVLDSVGG